MKAPHNANQPQAKLVDGVSTHVTPHLEKRAEFVQVLANYRLNPAAKEIIKATTMVVLNGPSGTGRNTVIRELLKTGHYHFIVSDTTRPPRYNDGVLETNGVEYFFRTEDEMLADLRRGEFLEAELIHDQQVSGQNVREIKKAHDLGKIALNEIEIIGILNTLRLKPDAIAILLLPPSFNEWLRRLTGRTALPQSELNRRLVTAQKIFETALSRDVFTFVVNDNLNHAVEQIDSIARAGKRSNVNDEPHRRLVQELLDQTRKYLTQHNI